MKKKYPHILYLIVGSSGDTKYVESVRSYAHTHNLESNLRIIDSIKNDQDLAAFYELTDVFVMNSNNDDTTHHFEGFGLVFLEAYQFGKPAVGSRNCGIEDAIDDGLTGYLSNQSDPKDIAEKISLIIEKDPTSFAAATKEMRKRFSWDTLAGVFLREYEEAA